MKLRRLLQAALRSIGRNRLRSLLTALGIVIGVAAVVVMVAVGRGAQRRVESQIASLGRNLLTVMPGAAQLGGIARGAGTASTLTLDDVDHLRDEARLVDQVSPLVRVGAQLVAGAFNWQTSVYGVSAEYLTIRDWPLASGDGFDARQLRIGSKVIILGQTVATSLFGDADPIGQRIRVGKVPFTVIGVLTAKGQGGFGNDQDDIALAPVTTVLGRLTGARNLQQILVSAIDAQSMSAAQDEVSEILRRQHRLAGDADDDFRVRNQADLAAAATATTQTFTLLLGAIASVSLLVGGIGIMNIMLVSVTERTREIGIRIAVGARGSDIMIQFLIEAVVLSVVGALIGAGLALLVCVGLTRVADLPATPEPVTLLLATAFAVSIGLIFGLAPARRAARLDPIEALRHE